MSFLVVFKRIEVWMLLAVVSGVLWIALMPESGEPAQKPIPVAAPGEPNPLPDKAPQEEAPILVVREVRMIESGGGTIIETILAGRSPTGSELLLDEASVRATTATGETVPRFFEPFQTPTLLAGTTETEATLRWWLTAPAEEIWLEISGLRLRAGVTGTPN